MRRRGVATISFWTVTVRAFQIHIHVARGDAHDSHHATAEGSGHEVRRRKTFAFALVILGRVGIQAGSGGLMDSLVAKVAFIFDVDSNHALFLTELTFELYQSSAQELFNLPLQIVTGIGIGQVPIFIHEPHGGDGIAGVFGPKFIFARWCRRNIVARVVRVP